jgi:putative mRNA 3-end processing factor
LFGYSLGKAQRLLALLDPSIGPIAVHGSIDALNAGYRAAGISLPSTTRLVEMPKGDAWHRALVLMPPSADAAMVERKAHAVSTAVASGWMMIRGMRRRRGVDRGFVLSDHVDWPSLLHAVSLSGAERVLATHGYVDVLVRWLREQGLDAKALATPYRGDALGDELDSGDDDNSAEIPVEAQHTAQPAYHA